MKKKETVELIKGKFAPAEAREIMITLITNKINFHQIRNSSLEERFGKSDKRSEKRIIELKKARDRVAAILETALEHGYHLNIHSEILIRLEK